MQIVVRADSLLDDDALLIASFMSDVPEQLNLVDLLSSSARRGEGDGPPGRSRRGLSAGGRFHLLDTCPTW